MKLPIKILLMAMLCVQTAFAYDFDNFNTKNHLVWSYFGGLAKFMVLTGDDTIGDEFIGKVGFIDQTGKVVIPLQYDEVLIFQEGLTGVKVGHKWGYIDMSNNMVIAPIYDNALNFNDGVSWVSLNDDDFVIDKQGKPIK